MLKHKTIAILLLSLCTIPSVSQSSDKYLIVLSSNLDGGWYTTLSTLKTQQGYNVQKMEVLFTMGS